nr:serine hydrolase domain-containing protein [Verrucosispora sioxanthis]
MTSAAGDTSAAGRLERMVRQVQAQARVPAVSAAVHRADRPLWTCTAGGTGNDTALDEQTRFRIGSVTKTFTAVLVMQCRDDGLLDLDDPLRRHLDLPAHGELTVRRLLSHTAGLQREPYGDVWDTLRAPDADQLITELARAERVLPTGRRYHYSNLGMALLGHLVGQLRGGSWAEVLTERVLTPLGLTATTAAPGPRAGPGSWSTRTPTRRIRSRPPTSARWVRPRSCGARQPTWPAGPPSWPTRRRWTRRVGCSLPPRSTRCAGR